MPRLNPHLPHVENCRSLQGMRCRLTALWLMLGIGLQGPLAVAEFSSPMQADGLIATESHPVAAHACCPKQGARGKCCPDACTGAAAVTGSPGLLVWQGRTVPGFHFPASSFSSHDETPLIRPPIL